MLAYHETCGTDICSLLEENPTSESIFVRLAIGEDVAIRFLAEIAFANIESAGSGIFDLTGDIGSHAICEADNESSGASSETQLFYSDGGWTGRPDDIARPNIHYEDRLRDPASINKRIPYLPELGRRAQTQFGDIEAISSDGELDSLSSGSTIDGRVIKLFVGNGS